MDNYFLYKQSCIYVNIYYPFIVRYIIVKRHND